MFGLIGKMRAAPGRRAELIAIIGGGSGKMPGCRSYVLAEDPADLDVIWITEIWESEAAHKASLQLQSVKDAIAKGRPLIAGFEMSVKTHPVAGV
ncbi:MAG: antibiotic biosynthesis monooxygenase [Alphaproteobacteria bacterium]|nr:antibiotic biosynthesis monooxygenase [Alphaproteobacteria bacterium]